MGNNTMCENNNAGGAEDMEGINGNKFFAIPHDRIQQIIKKYKPR